MATKKKSQVSDTIDRLVNATKSGALDKAISRVTENKFPSEKEISEAKAKLAVKGKAKKYWDSSISIPEMEEKAGVPKGNKSYMDSEPPATAMPLKDVQGGKNASGLLNAEPARKPYINKNDKVRQHYFNSKLKDI